MRRNKMQDPVCGAHLEEIDTAVLTCFEGQILAFCSHRCLNDFSEHPQDFPLEEKSLKKAS